MKTKITLLFLMIGLAVTAQHDFKMHTSWVMDYAKLTSKKDLQAGYVKNKMDALKLDEKKPIIKATDGQKEKFTTLFTAHYPEFKAAYDNYKEKESAVSKIEMIKVLIKHEEEFRALLNDAQKLDYISFDVHKGWNTNMFFQIHFFTDKQLLELKKELL